ncbi:MAG: hypothetical protein ABFD49_10150 [Armatimonadota bacterium]|nr:hypothetical protein [bacterium]
MDTQSLLEAYLNSPGSAGDKYWEDLSDAVSTLVHRFVSKREVGDIEDFEEDCILAIWTKISALKTKESDGTIDNIEAFVRRAVHNRYCDAIRRKRPTWYNLKLELLEIFSGKANIGGFALWQNPDTGSRLCGFADWEGSSKQTNAKCREILDNHINFRNKFLRNQDPHELPTYELAAAIFDYCRGPVEIDALTSCMADLTQIRTADPLSIDAQPEGDDDAGSPIEWLISPDVEVEKQVVDSGWFSHVIDWFWQEFVQLSIKQRKALLYGMSGDQVMALAAAVGMKEVAKSLEMNTHQLASLISKLPIPDALTADELGIQARAVPSVRFKAWGRIRRRTKKSALSLDEEQALA